MLRQLQLNLSNFDMYFNLLSGSSACSYCRPYWSCGFRIVWTGFEPLSWRPGVGASSFHYWHPLGVIWKRVCLSDTVSLLFLIVILGTVCFPCYMPAGDRSRSSAVEETVSSFLCLLGQNGASTQPRSPKHCSLCEPTLLPVWLLRFKQQYNSQARRAETRSNLSGV